MNEAIIYTIIAILVTVIGSRFRKIYLNIILGFLNILIALEVMNIDYRYSFLIIALAFGNFYIAYNEGLL